jgi:nucleoside permease NupC
MGRCHNHTFCTFFAFNLCGFSNIASIGIQLGALGAMAPSRRSDLSKVIIRAMIAGNIACFMTACISGKYFGAQLNSY